MSTAPINSPPPPLRPATPPRPRPQTSTTETCRCLGPTSAPVVPRQAAPACNQQEIATLLESSEAATSNLRRLLASLVRSASPTRPTSAGLAPSPDLAPAFVPRPATCQN